MEVIKCLFNSCVCGNCFATAPVRNSYTTRNIQPVKIQDMDCDRDLDKDYDKDFDYDFDFDKDLDCDCDTDFDKDFDCDYDYDLDAPFSMLA